MDAAVLVAVTGRGEAALVAAVDACPGLRVVRRCADLAELVAAARAGLGRLVVVSADLHRLDREALARLAADGAVVVGAVRPGGDDEQRLAALGVAHRVLLDARGEELAAVLRGALDEDGADGAGRPVSADPAAPAPARAGRVVAVWGTGGAPGRTTTATALGAELAATGRQVLLVDADTWGASTAQVLGLLDESAGVAAACRAAAAGALDPAALAGLAPLVLPGMRVLTGLPRPARWPEVGPVALEAVLATARELADWVVVDCAAPLEADEEITSDVDAPRRNAAALAALEHADEVLVVGAGDPVGLARLVRSLGELAEAVPGASRRVVVTKVRASAVGPSPAVRVREVLARWAGCDDPVLVPDDRAGCDAALLAGRTLAEAAPSSPARLALRDLARDLVDAARPAGEIGPARTGRAARRAERRATRRLRRPVRGRRAAAST